MGITARFVFEEHPDYGDYGLKMVGRHWCDPLGALAAAHDILEHGPNDDGSTEHEFMALGASLYVRDGSNYYCAKGRYGQSAAYNISGEFDTQARYLEEAGRDYLRSPGRTLSCDADADIDEAIALGVKNCAREYDGEIPPFLEPQELWKVRGWMRRGYRAAQRRWRGIPSWKMCQLFTNIENELDEAIKTLEHNEMYGAEVVVRVEPRTERVQVQIVGLDDE